MKPESVAFGVAGILFGLIAGWIIGSQQAPQPPAGATAAATAPERPQPPPLDEAQVSAFEAIASRDPSNAPARAELGNLYFAAERFDEAIKWYTEALKLSPTDVAVSTHLGMSYYYVNQPDRALEQFDRSLKLDPKHVTTWLNVGVVRAFGKQDLPGAEAAWQQVVQLAPDSPEGQAARRALESMRSVHPTGPATEGPGTS
jgi:tetratricopeptide (TPR) repeat protein